MWSFRQKNQMRQPDSPETNSPHTLRPTSDQGSFAIVLTLVTLAVSLLILTLGAESLVRGAVRVAARLGVSSFFIGLTIVGFGTSAPELATGIAAAIKGAADINAGNVIGSNIFNVAVVIGLSALICPIPVKTHLVRSEAWLVIAVSMAPFLTLLTASTVTRPLAALMLAALFVYLVRGYAVGRVEAVPAAIEDPVNPLEARAGRSTPALDLALVIFGVGLLWLGSHFLVESATTLARYLGISELVIALTIVACGTSLPELVTSLLSAIRKQSDIAVGNVLGSNIFNILGILGVTSLIQPQALKPQVIAFDTPVMLIAAIALLPIMLSGSRVTRTEGVLLLIGYTAYVTVLLVFAPGWFPSALP